MQVKATASVIAGGVLWGLMSLFVNSLNALGFTALDICLFRAVFSALLLGTGLALARRELLSIRLKDCWMFVGTGLVSLVLFNWCYFSTIQQSQASVAVALLYTSPVFVTLFAALLFKEKLTWLKGVAVMLTVGGCVLISGALGGGYRLSAEMLLTGVASGLFYGLYSIFGRYALRRYEPLTVTFYTFLFASLGTVLTVDTSRAWGLLMSSSAALVWVMGISVLITILPYFLYTYGLNYLETGKAAVLVTIEPLVGGLVGIFVYGEPYNAAKLCGMALIFASTILLNLPEKE